MRISTAAGLIDIGLLIEAAKETEKLKKGEDKYAKGKTSQKPSPCGSRNK
jgi:hypothetical protein